MSFIPELLRAPAQVIARCSDPIAQREMAKTSLLVIALGGLLFGAAAGSFRGLPQLAIAAAKLPIVTLVTLAVAGPAFFAISAAVDRRHQFRTTLTLVLCAGARSSLVLIAVAPLLALAVDFGAPYELVRFGALAGYGLAGLSALAFIIRAMGDARGRALGLVSFLLVFSVFGAQTAWLFRPYLGDPRDETVPLFAHGRIEGGLVGALVDRAQR